MAKSKKKSKKCKKKEDIFDIIKGNPVLAMDFIKALDPKFEDKIREGQEYKDVLLGNFLKMAVPRYVELLQDAPYKEIEIKRKKIATTIGSKGDILLYGGKKKGECASVFCDFSEGVAILAMFAKEGVEIFGEKFDYPCPEHWK